MHQIELRGSYFEMGRQQGLLLRGWQVPALEPQMARFALRCREELAEHAPELLEELHGLAEAAGLDPEALIDFSLTCPFDDSELPDAGCTVLAVLPERAADNRTIVGRNYDYFYDSSQEGATIYRTYPEGRYASLGNCDIWVGREDGLNEAGLFVAQAAFFTRGLQPGLAFWFIVRLLLDRCATVDEGLDLILRLPHAASWTYLLADRSGNAAAVEPTVKGIEVRYPVDGLLVMTNHAVCSCWAGTEEFIPPDSRPRFRRLRELLGKGPAVDVAAVKGALTDHQGLVCSHGDHFPQRPFGTLWSVVGRPGERQLEIAAGQPCCTAYQTLGF